MTAHASSADDAPAATAVLRTTYLSNKNMKVLVRTTQEVRPTSRVHGFHHVHGASILGATPDDDDHGRLSLWNELPGRVLGHLSRLRPVQVSSFVWSSFVVGVVPAGEQQSSESRPKRWLCTFSVGDDSKGVEPPFPVAGGA